MNKIHNIVGEYLQILNTIRPESPAANVELLVNLYNFLDKQFDELYKTVGVYNINVHFYNMQEWEKMYTIYGDSVEGYYETETIKVIFGEACGIFYVVDKFNK